MCLIAYHHIKIVVLNVTITEMKTQKGIIIHSCIQQTLGNCTGKTDLNKRDWPFNVESLHSNVVARTSMSRKINDLSGDKKHSMDVP